MSEDIKRELIASSPGPTPEQLKDKVEKSELPAVIRYNGKVYEIRFNELRNLGLDHYDAVEQRAREFGLDYNPFFGRPCHHCGYNEHNIINVILKARVKEPVIVEDTSKLRRTCSYHKQPKVDVRIAGPFKNNDTGMIAYAEQDRCAFDDALVSYLADNGHLEKFESKREYNFLPIDAFEFGIANPEDFQVQEPRKSLVARIFKALKLKS